MTAYRTQHDYTITAYAVAELYEREPEEARNTAIELHTILHRAAEADNPDTELAIVKNARAVLQRLRDFQEDHGRDTWAPEQMDKNLATAQERLEQGLPPLESWFDRITSRSRGTPPSGHTLSLAVALCLAA